MNEKVRVNGIKMNEFGLLGMSAQSLSEAFHKRAQKS
jgi:hypothetical protein